MFLGVKCWRKKDLTPNRLREVGKSIGLPVSIVEREVIFYDTLEAICSFSPTPVVLKGGTLISRVYSECPRFSWDIDLSADIRSKGDYSLAILNRRIRRAGRTQLIKIGRKTIELGKFERDVGKDVFVDMLSLKRDMLTLSIGASFPTYLRKKGMEVERLKGEILSLRETFGSLPFVDSVRATISLAEIPIETRRERIKSILRDVLRPAKTVRARVYPPELCLVEKFSRMSKSVEDVGLRDLLCDFYDIGQLLRQPIDGKKLRESFAVLYRRREIAGVKMLSTKIEKNLSVVRRNLDLFEKRREFAWCRYRWGEYFSWVEGEVKGILKDLERSV
ncbi:MAG: nucleotidyl transferase AbiEii/AbiGii toxin family protein [Candidatus Hadarchaeales archaeon]